jgi:hypothetical protein
MDEEYLLASCMPFHSHFHFAEIFPTLLPHPLKLKFRRRVSSPQPWVRVHPGASRLDTAFGRELADCVVEVEDGFLIVAEVATEGALAAEAVMLGDLRE